MAQTAYWIAHATASWPGTPTGAQIAAGNLSSGSPASYSGSETGFATSGTVTIDEATALTGLTGGTSYTVAWVVFDGSTYSNVQTGEVVTGIAVPAGTLTLTGNAPTVTATANQTVEVPAGTLTLTGYAPTVSAGANNAIDVPAGAITLTGYAPTVTATANNTIAVPAGTLSLTGYEPIVTTGDSQVVQVPAAALTLTGYAPTVIASEHNAILVPAGTLTLAGYAPTVSNGSGGTGATAAEIVAALMAEEVEPGVSVRMALRILLAAVSGPTAGIGTSTERYYDPDGVTARITATFDNDSNRTSVTLDGS